MPAKKSVNDSVDSKTRVVYFLRYVSSLSEHQAKRSVLLFKPGFVLWDGMVGSQA